MCSFTGRCRHWELRPGFPAGEEAQYLQFEGLAPFSRGCKSLNASIKYFQDFLSIAIISPDLFIHIAILRLLVFFHDYSKNENRREKAISNE